MFPAALLLVVALAAADRLRGLADVGLGGDEAVYLSQGLGRDDPAWAGVRAHPPLLGVLLQSAPDGVPGEVGGRVVSVVLGLLAVVGAGLLARRLAGGSAGVVAAVALALMPYHRDVTRLVLVDVPMATCLTFALLMLLHATGPRSRPGLVVGAAVLLGVATLFKETAVLVVVAVVVASALGVVEVDRRTVVRSAIAYLAVVAVYPGWLVAVDGVGTAARYVQWQLSRTGGGSTSYLDVVLPRVGWAVVVAAAVGALAAVRSRHRGAVLTTLVVVVPLAFFALWPVRGYPYLLLTAPLAAALAGVGVAATASWLRARPRLVRVPAVTGLAGAVLLLGPVSTSAEPPDVPAAAGVPAVREAAVWLRGTQAVPVVTASAWVSNVVRYYAQGHPVSTMATSPPATLNPATRDTSVTTLPPGPAAVVWDAWSAATTPDVAGQLLRQVRERGGRVTHVEVAPGREGARPLVVVYLVEVPDGERVASLCCPPS